MKRVTSHPGIHSLFGLVLLLTAICSSAFSARAQDTPASEQEVKEVPAFTDAMQQMAAEVAKFLEQKSATKLTVGPFVGPPGTSGGPGIEQGIKDALPDTIQTDPGRNQMGLSGEFSITNSPSSGQACIEINGTVKSPLGKPMLNLTRYVLADEESIASLVGGSGSVPTQPKPGQTLTETRKEALVENFLDPKVDITVPPAQAGQPAPSPSIARVPNSPFGVEILVFVGGKYVPAPITNQDGLATVDLQKGQDYAVRIINDGDQPIGAAINIDGINSLVFSSQFSQVGKWVVGPKAPNAVIKGWHKGPDPITGVNRPTSSFRITDYGDSVAGRAGVISPKIGTVSVQFFAASTGDLPRDEPPPEATGRGDLATGEGSPVEQNAKPVFMKFGVMRGEISIRYVRENEEGLPMDPPPQ
ncbi:MAG: hypothetical protein AB7I37_20660 [Pirellulales bacterium]